MEEFNFENAQAFLEQCRKKAQVQESTRQVILRLAPKIRELEESGFSKRQIHAMLVENYDLKLAFETFRSYMSEANRNEGVQRKKRGSKNSPG